MTTVTEVSFFEDSDVPIIDANGTKYAVGEDEYVYYTILHVEPDVVSDNPDTYQKKEGQKPISLPPDRVDKLASACDL